MAEDAGDGRSRLIAITPLPITPHPPGLGIRGVMAWRQVAHGPNLGCDLQLRFEGSTIIS